MEIIFEIVFQVLGEFLLQGGLEFIAELFTDSLPDRSKRTQNAVWSCLGFMICGAIAGGVSLLILPQSAIHDPALRTINLVVTPALIGGMMVLLGKIRQKKGQDLNRLDRFGYAFVFAFCMNLVRFVWAA